jgi:hypothetical protein
MSQWKNTDHAANSVLWGVDQYKKPANSVNQTAFFGNVTADAFFTGVTVGQYGVSTSEMAGSAGVASITITNPGSGFEVVPTIAIDAAPAYPGVNSTATAVGKVVAFTVDTKGTGYAPGDVLAVDGGTGTAATANVTATEVVAIAIGDVPGTGYAPGDIAGVLGGTGSTRAAANVTSTKVVSIAIGAEPGTGYAPGDIVGVVGGTGTRATANVTATKVVAVAIGDVPGTGYSNSSVVGLTSGTGQQALFNVVTGDQLATYSVPQSLTSNSAGSYTVNPTLDEEVTAVVEGTAGTGLTVDLTMGVSTIALKTAGEYTDNPSLNEAVTANSTGLGTGLTVDLVMGAAAVEIDEAGVYTANPTELNEAATVNSTGLGVGLTVDLTMGVSTVAVKAAGAYTALPDLSANEVTGGGTGAKLNVDIGVGTVTMDTIGSGYTSTPGVTISGTGGVGAAAAAVMQTTGKGIAHAGWNVRTAGSGGRAGRVQYETLVAMSSITGDASDDTVLPE